MEGIQFSLPKKGMMDWNSSWLSIFGWSSAGLNGTDLSSPYFRRMAVQEGFFHHSTSIVKLLKFRPLKPAPTILSLSKLRRLLMLKLYCLFFFLIWVLAPTLFTLQLQLFFMVVCPVDILMRWLYLPQAAQLWQVKKIIKWNEWLNSPSIVFPSFC